MHKCTISVFCTPPLYPKVGSRYLYSSTILGILSTQELLIQYKCPIIVQCWDIPIDDDLVKAILYCNFPFPLLILFSRLLIACEPLVSLSVFYQRTKQNKTKQNKTKQNKTKQKQKTKQKLIELMCLLW